MASQFYDSASEMWYVADRLLPVRSYGSSEDEIKHETQELANNFYDSLKQLGIAMPGALLPLLYWSKGVSATEIREHWLGLTRDALKEAVFYLGELPNNWSSPFPGVPLRDLETFKKWLIFVSRDRHTVASAQDALNDSHLWLQANDIPGRPEWISPVPDTVPGCVAEMGQIVRFLNAEKIELAVEKPSTITKTADLKIARPVPAKPERITETAVRSYLLAMHFRDGEIIDAEPVGLDTVVSVLGESPNTKTSKSTVSRAFKTLFNGCATYKRLLGDASQSHDPSQSRIYRILRGEVSFLQTDGNDTIQDVDTTRKLQKSK